MTSGPDFVVYSPDHEPQLIVEVKGAPASDEKWAAKLRRNLLAHGVIPAAPYFLLVLPDHLYLWRDHEGSEAALPDYSGDTRQVLHRYLMQWNGSTQHEPLSKRGLELAVSSWLLDLTRPAHGKEPEPVEDEWLKDSGLPERLRTGVVQAESAA